MNPHPRERVKIVALIVLAFYTFIGVACIVSVLSA